MLSLYLRCLDYPRLMLAFVLSVCLLAVIFLPRFSFEASSDTLVVEGDPDLAFYREIEQRFGGEETLFLTYAPAETDSLFSSPVLAEISEIQAQIEALDNVSSVFSILDAPLLDNSSGTDLREISQLLTLRSNKVNYQLASNELSSSPLYADLLVSRDAKSMALRISLSFKTDLEGLRKQLTQLRYSNTTEPSQLADIEARYQAEKLRYSAQRKQLINSVRAIRDAHNDKAQLYLGGVPMIAEDMISYVINDVVVFSVLVAIIIILMLYLFFRRIRWILLPLFSSALTVVLLMSWLGFIRQPITVVSSNVLTLLAIISLSFSIHLIVRYRELLANQPNLSHKQLVLQTMRSKFAPCFYTALTTMVAFASLSSSDILPVENFGWMMCTGIIFALLIAFTFFPALLLIFPRDENNLSTQNPLALNQFLSHLARNRAPYILSFTLILSAVVCGGLYQLSINNRFIDYFKDDTEIRAGMQYIDEHLGGTVPFEVIVKFSPFETQEVNEEDAFLFEEEEEFPEKYWFTPSKLLKLRHLHQYIEEMPHTGKIISLATLDQVGRDHNEGNALESMQLAGVLGALPDTLRAQLIDPYANPASGEMRISGRVKESGPLFSREQMVKDIKLFAGSIGFTAEEVRVTGMMVLFNNMLMQLFHSQTSTLAYVLLATLLMFALLVRSVNLALIGLLPNVVAAATVIAFMGYAGIPLDMMTITIAAISIGIGVDDAIHYLHRFRAEFDACGDVREAIKRSHASIGQAMYFTSITIVAGFSVLSFSNFLPTVYFGLLTALAMIFALLANLTILPALLVIHPSYRKTHNHSVLPN